MRIEEYGESSTNEVCFRNCSAYSKPMTSHALGVLAGRQRMPLHEI